MKNLSTKKSVAKISTSICILMTIMFVIIAVFLNVKLTRAKAYSVNQFSIVEGYNANGYVLIGRNLSKYELSSSEPAILDCVDESFLNIGVRELSLLRKLGFEDSEIEEMSNDEVQLYTNTDYIERRTVEYSVESNQSETDIMPLMSGSETYNKLKVTNTLVSNGTANGNNRYVASIKVVWTSKPANQLTDFMYIACGNGSTVYSSQYRECYLSYTNRIIVPQVGTTTSDVKYTNNDGSGKIVSYNDNANGEGWKIDVPFMPSVNQYFDDITFFMQAEITLPQNTTGGVYYAYFHQKIVGSAGFSVSTSGPSVSFSKKYTMDLFSGPHFTIESNGAIV